MNNSFSVFRIVLAIFLLGTGCNQVELKTKLELTTKSVKWSQLYVKIHALHQHVQSVQAQIQSNQKEIQQKISLLEDSTQIETITKIKSRYFYQLNDFQRIAIQSEKLHQAYVKNRTLYNHWLNTVQNDVISEERALTEYQIFEKKYEYMSKEYLRLRKAFYEFVQASNQLADELTEVIPDLVGIKFSTKGI